MSYNRKALSKAKLDLDKYKKPNPYKKDIIYTEQGQWKFPGQKTRIPSSDITMQGVPYPVFAQPNIGKPQMMYPGQEYNFPGADYVDETPMAKKGGLVQMPKPTKKGLASKKYSRSLSATNKLFTENPLFKKPKSKKRKVFDPNAKYFEPGGELDNNPPKSIVAKPSWYQEPVVNPAAYVSGFRGGNPNMYKYGFLTADKGNIIGGGGLGFPKSGIELSGLGVVPTSPLEREYFKGAYNAKISKDINRNLNLGLGVDTSITGYPGETGFVRDPIKFQPNLNLIYNFQPGGSVDIDVTEDDIAKYVNGGYIVEELPEMQPGGTWKPGTVVRPTLSKSDMATIKKEVAKAKPVAVKKPVAKKQSTSSFADRAAQVNKENKLKGIENISVDEATWNANRDRQNKEHLSELLTGAGEITGINSAIRTGERIVDDPLKFADDLTTGISQAPETLVEGAMTLGSKLFGDNKDYVDVDTDALGVAADFAGALPVIGTAGKVAKPFLKSGAKYLTAGPLKNAYKINPWALKENPEMFLYRARPVGQNPDMNMATQLKAKEAAGEPLTWFQKNIINNSKIKEYNPSLYAREKYYGQWFEKDPSRLDFYIDPGTRNFADNDVIEILRTRLPKSEAAKLNVSQFDDAKVLSSSPETEFILPKNMVESAERFPESSWQQLIQEDKAFNTPHWLRGYKPVEVLKQQYGGNSNYKNGGNINNYAPGGELSPKDLDPATLEKYLSDLRVLENSVKKGYKNNKWYPHASVERGRKTIAYGHKLKPGESFASGLTEQQAKDLQLKDVLVHQAIAEKDVDDKYGKGTYDKLPQNSQMMLTDYAYNLGGLGKFPSFVEGVVKGDKNKMLREYERTGLPERNKWTQNVINTTDFSKGSDEGFNWFNLGWWNKKNGGAIEIDIKNKEDLKRYVDQGFIIEEL